MLRRPVEGRLGGAQLGGVDLGGQGGLGRSRLLLLLLGGGCDGPLTVHRVVPVSLLKVKVR